MCELWESVKTGNAFTLYIFIAQFHLYSVFKCVHLGTEDMAQWVRMCEDDSLNARPSTCVKRRMELCMCLQPQCGRGGSQRIESSMAGSLGTGSVRDLAQRNR